MHRVERMGEKRNACKVLVGGAGNEEKRPLGRPRHREDDNIKMDQMVIEWEAIVIRLSGSEMGQMAVFCDCGHEILHSIKCGKFSDQLRT